MIEAIFLIEESDSLLPTLLLTAVLIVAVIYIAIGLNK